MFYSYFILTIYQSFAFELAICDLGHIGTIPFNFQAHIICFCQICGSFFREVPLHDTFAAVFAYSLAHLLQVYCFKANGPV